MLKILHISPYYKPAQIYGGPVNSISSLCENLALLNSEVTVFTTNANGKRALDFTPHQTILNEVEVHYFKRWTGDSTFFAPSLLKKLWQESAKFDVIHIHTWWNLVALFSVFICWMKGIKPILSTRGMIGDYSFGYGQIRMKKWVHFLIGKWLLKKTILHATVLNEANEGLKINEHWDYFIAPNIVNLPESTFNNSSSKISNNSIFQLLFLSRIHEVKGLELLFESLSNLSFDWHLKIAGDGDEQYVNSLKNLAKQFQIAPKITWLGWVNNESKETLFRTSDLFVLLSKSENFGNVIIESLAEGLPVLISQEVGASDYVKTSGLGWVCNRNPFSVQSVIEEIQTNLNNRNQIVQIAPRKVRVDFDGQILARQYLIYYNKLKYKAV